MSKMISTMMIAVVNPEKNKMTNDSTTPILLSSVDFVVDSVLPKMHNNK